MTKPTKRAPARNPAKPAPSKPRAAKARRPKATKPQKVKGVRKPEIVRRKLVWRGVLVAIRYEPNPGGYFDHLELRVVGPQGAPIPVTETGYRSAYPYPNLVKAAGGPVAYVRKWLDQEARSPAYRRALDRWRQLDLFAALES